MSMPESLASSTRDLHGSGEEALPPVSAEDEELMLAHEHAANAAQQAMRHRRIKSRATSLPIMPKMPAHPHEPHGSMLVDDSPMTAGAHSPHDAFLDLFAPNAASFLAGAHQTQAELLEDLKAFEQAFNHNMSAGGQAAQWQPQHRAYQQQSAQSRAGHAPAAGQYLVRAVLFVLSLLMRSQPPLPALQEQMHQREQIDAELMRQLQMIDSQGEDDLVSSFNVDDFQHDDVMALAEMLLREE